MRKTQAFNKSAQVLIATLLVLLCQVTHSMSMPVTPVPERMLLSATMKAADIGKAMLIALSIDPSAKTVIEKDIFYTDEVIKSHTGKSGSICFVVRRPG